MECRPPCRSEQHPISPRLLEERPLSTSFCTLAAAEACSGYTGLLFWEDMDLPWLPRAFPFLEIKAFLIIRPRFPLPGGKGASCQGLARLRGTRCFESKDFPPKSLALLLVLCCVLGCQARLHRLYTDCRSTQNGIPSPAGALAARWEPVHLPQKE